MPLEIRKANRILGRTILFRNALPQDAAFILGLRTDSQRSRHISSTSPSLASQIQWLQGYKSSTGQAYFVICTLEEAPLGTIRLYDQRGDSFCWGSWILVPGCASHVAIESALMAYSYGIFHLGFEASHFDVRKSNERVWQFHERFGAVRTGETELDYLYSIDRPAIENAMSRYRKFLPNPVSVEEPCEH